MTYVYRQTEPGVYTVGFYRPDGVREPESDHPTASAAAQRVAYLNGGPLPPETTPEEPFAEASRRKFQVVTEDIQAKWEPEGGRYCVYSNGLVFSAPSTQDCRVFGMERPTEAQAIALCDWLRPLLRLKAWADEHARPGPYHLVRTGDEWAVVASESPVFFFPGRVTMDADSARKLADLLNAGRVEL